MDKILTVLTPPFILMTPLPLTVVFYDGARIVFCSFMNKIFRPVCSQKIFVCCKNFTLSFWTFMSFPFVLFSLVNAVIPPKITSPNSWSSVTYSFSYLLNDCNLKPQMNLLLLKETPKPSISKFAVSENLSPTKQELLWIFAIE